MKRPAKKAAPRRNKPRPVGKKVTTKARAFQLMRRGREVFLKVWK